MAVDSRDNRSRADLQANLGGGVGNILLIAKRISLPSLSEVALCRTPRAGLRGRRTQSFATRFLDGDSPADNLRGLRVVSGAVRAKFRKSLNGGGVAVVA